MNGFGICCSEWIILEKSCDTFAKLVLEKAAIMITYLMKRMFLLFRFDSTLIREA